MCILPWVVFWIIVYLNVLMFPDYGGYASVCSEISLADLLLYFSCGVW